MSDDSDRTDEAREAAERRLGSRLDEFPENAVGRALLQLVPGGAAVDAFIGAVAAKLGRERFEQFVLDAYEEIQELDERKLDRGFLNSAEGFDFFLEVVDRVVRTQDEERPQALRRVFINGSTIGASRSPIKHMMVRLAGELTGEHVKVLRAVQDAQDAFQPGREADEGTNPDPYASYDVARAALPELTDTDFATLVSDMFRQQFVLSWWEGRYGGMGQRTPRRDRLVLSPLAKAFARYISEPGPFTCG